MALTDCNYVTAMRHWVTTADSGATVEGGAAEEPKQLWSKTNSGETSVAVTMLAILHFFDVFGAMTALVPKPANAESQCQRTELEGRRRW